MLRWLGQVDQILRGDATRAASLRSGQIDTPMAGVAIMAVLLGAVSGVCTGSYAVFREAWSETGITSDSVLQVVASAVKMPLLFILTLLVTFPSLYVFNALLGSRLSLMSVWRLMVAMTTVMLTVLASLGPIVVFFAVSTESYPFMKLLNVVMASIAGGLGLTFLLRTLNRLVHPYSSARTESRWTAPQTEVVRSEMEGADPDTEGADPAVVGAAMEEIGVTDRALPEEILIGALESDRPTTERARAVFRIWVVVFGLVGAQMSWVLRPFIGSPNLPFSWLRDRDSNFFLDLAATITSLLGS